MYSPFDFNEAMGHRKDFVEEALRPGSPAVGIAYEGGIALLSVQRSQRKIYEIYDRQMFSAIGRQADIENIRLASIQMMHQEGFERSPDDVSVQRLVGFSLSPALKKAFGEQFAAPFVIRALFAELGRQPGTDTFFTLNYDGEFRQHKGVAVVAGTSGAEDAMLEKIGEPNPGMAREEALHKALSAWSLGAREAIKRRLAIGGRDDGDDYNPLRDIDETQADAVFLRDELKNGKLEVGLLERRGVRDSRFRLLSSDELDNLIKDHI
jgi:proteasome alpha subunit